jgi:hypothetical protein
LEFTMAERSSARAGAIWIYQPGAVN